MQLVFVEVLRTLDDLEQRIGERRRVTVVDGEQQPLQSRSHPGVDTPDRAEVQQAQLPAAQQENVARMRNGVEDPVDHDLPQEAVEEAAGQRVPVGGQHAGLDRREGLAVQAFHDQDAPGGHGPDRDRDPHPCAAPQGRGGGDRGHVALLDAQVEFLAQGIAESVSQVDGPRRPAPPGAALQPESETLEDPQIWLDHDGRLGPADLDHHPLARPEVAA